MVMVAGADDSLPTIRYVPAATGLVPGRRMTRSG
jgi:hypothetical protein